ncbi:MAG: hypothetical protein IKG42_07040 [Clostridia bacterium]|nr:hypothetical protein [Clostridia bacterium]
MGYGLEELIQITGEIIGSIESPECKIDSISQSWSIISDAADNDKKYHSINSLESHLVDRQAGIIKLLTPAFSKSDLEPGYIKRYPEGIRENGGQYTHAAIWAIIAFTKLGFGDKAVDLFEMISPIGHSKTPEKSDVYKIEPYVISADIYSNPDMLGRGGWSWYTGSSSWYYKAGIENILGLQVNNGKLRINPCIKSDWKEYEIKYKYKSSLYEIKIYNPNGNNTGVKEVKINGVVQEDKEIVLRDDGGNYFIEVEML